MHIVFTIQSMVSDITSIPKVPLLVPNTALYFYEVEM